MKNNVIIGYTTGVFDLFHIGHLNVLRRAKQECDYLVVGVSTDELVRKYKKHSPIIQYCERSEIVAACKYVDKVVPQSTRDKLEAYESIKFDKMFVGDDWKGKPPFDELEQILELKGVKIIYFPYTKTTSSSMIRKILSDIS